MTSNAFRLSGGLELMEDPVLSAARKNADDILHLTAKEGLV